MAAFETWRSSRYQCILTLTPGLRIFSLSRQVTRPMQLFFFGQAFICVLIGWLLRHFLPHNLSCPNREPVRTSNQIIHSKSPMASFIKDIYTDLEHTTKLIKTVWVKWSLASGDLSPSGSCALATEAGSPGACAQLGHCLTPCADGATRKEVVSEKGLHGRTARLPPWVVHNLLLRLISRTFCVSRSPAHTKLGQ